MDLYAWTNSDYNATIYTNILTPLTTGPFYDSEGNNITSYVNNADCGVSSATSSVISWSVGGKGYTIPPTSSVATYRTTYNYNRDSSKDILETRYMSKFSDGTNTYTVKDSEARTSLSGKQDILVSGTNIKTINNTSLLGSGNISIATNEAYTVNEIRTIWNSVTPNE